MPLTPSAASALAVELSRAVVDGHEGGWPHLVARLEPLSGRDWLVLDAAARRYRPADGTPVSGVSGWVGPNLAEPSGFVAAVTSLHVDGRLRERATHALAGAAGPVAVAAAAVRMLDHVEQVRVAAAGTVAALLVSAPDPQPMVRALDVVLAGRGRSQGPGALETLERLARRSLSDAGYTDLLLSADPGRVRRHGFKVANETGRLPVARLLEAVRAEEDQLVVAWCADWLLERAEPERFADLLDAGSALVRQVAVLRADDGSLPDDRLLQLTADRAPRVREAARFRARRRGLAVAPWYREQLDADLTASREAAVLDGLLDVGDASDLPRFRAAMDGPKPRVRAVGLRGVATWAPPARSIDLLVPLMLDPSPRVSAAAARALARAGAPSRMAAEAWESTLPGCRRAAWMLARSAGGWDAVESDLRVAVDPDPVLASLGRTQLSNWLSTGAATTWQPLPSVQRDTIAQLLGAWDASVEVKRTLAFHAGIRPLPGEDVPDDLPADVVPIHGRRRRGAPG